MNKTKQRPAKLLTLDVLVRIRGGSVLALEASPTKTADKVYYQ